MAATQVQCPNCGGYEVYTTTTYIDPRTGRAVGTGIGLGCVMAILTTVISWVIVLAVVIALAFFTAISLGPHLSPTQVQREGVIMNQIILAAGVIIPLLLGIMVFMRFQSKNQKAISNGVAKYHSTCALCGKIWDWDAAHPQYATQIRYDLIQQGRKRLAEQQAQAAAAWTWQQQQNARNKR
jgi:hypothetical protein